MPRPLRSPLPWIAGLALVLALAFLGSRGIWDPDEGRYTNVALNMLDSGDWLNPRRSHEVGHWTKPPLTYWAIATSVAAFGANAFAARLPAALAYLLSTWLVWRLGRRLAPGHAPVAALAYATMLLPFGASQLITTDYLLAAFSTLAMWGYVEARFGAAAAAPRVGARELAWVALMWVGFALAFLTKGPPGLLPLLVVVAADALVPGPRTHRVLQWSGLGLFALLALPWYVAVIHGNPGLFAYFIGDEVVNRVTTNEFGRNGEWYGWLKVYAPTLLVGTLPWTPTLLRWAHGLPAQARAWRRDRARRADDAPWLLLALWVLLPLAVFCASRSRLPLYLLPLFAPLALLVALQHGREGRALPRWPWLAAWAALLLALKLGAAAWPTHKNAAAWAEAIRARAPERIEEVVFVEDMARYGLHVHLGRGVQIEKVSLGDAPQARFNPAFDESLAAELAEREPHVVWVCKQAQWPALAARIGALGYRASPLGAPYEGRVLFRVEPVAPPR
ncbi:ArnT family glycosyltransferase [Cognatilysobacter tabacisoli]|uniref:ArnT family glycosyltransferase n=1 Tax=Cognatilysobacter tabacisoli TaxID=2315424 RepID=UPI000E6AEECD|nr:glycosyltransferase family 39 protein [Lysobacter tabacisoli]